MLLAGQRILVIAAHPDDEVLGCGATLARAMREGATVCVGILGEGPTSRGGSSRGMPSQTIEDALAQLGVKEYRRASVADQKFDVVGQLHVNQCVEEWVAEFKPTVVLCHDATDLNTDHVIAHRAALIACRPASGVKALLAFEVACSSEWALADRFRPNVFVDVTIHDLNDKLSALAVYGELRSDLHPQTRGKISAAADHMGAIGGGLYAEGFRALRVSL